MYSTSTIQGIRHTYTFQTSLRSNLEYVWNHFYT